MNESLKIYVLIAANLLSIDLKYTGRDAIHENRSNAIISALFITYK